ncbi:MAG: hypothetical protein ACLQOO_31375 [Terriglobia bacterium]
MARHGFVEVTKTVAVQGLNRIAAAEGVQRVVSYLDPEDRELARQITGHLITPMD